DRWNRRGPAIEYFLRKSYIGGMKNVWGGLIVACALGCDGGNSDPDIGLDIDLGSGDADLSMQSDALLNGDLSGDDLASCTNDSACSLGGNNGLCNAGHCVPCVDSTDDAKCSSAYGASHLCISGACTPGDCRQSADCNGTVCG